MSVTISDSAGIAYLKGEEDSSNAAERRAALRRCIRSGAATVAVDLGELTFIDASAVSDLLHLAEELQKEGRKLEVRRCSREIHKLLHMAGLGLVSSVHFTGHASPPERVLRRKAV